MPTSLAAHFTDAFQAGELLESGGTYSANVPFTLRVPATGDFVDSKGTALPNGALVQMAYPVDSTGPVDAANPTAAEFAQMELVGGVGGDAGPYVALTANGQQLEANKRYIGTNQTGLLAPVAPADGDTLVLRNASPITSGDEITVTIAVLNPADGSALAGGRVPPGVEYALVWRAAVSAWTLATDLDMAVSLDSTTGPGTVLRANVTYEYVATGANDHVRLPAAPNGEYRVRLTNGSTSDLRIEQYDPAGTQQIRQLDNTVVPSVTIEARHVGEHVDFSGAAAINRYHAYPSWAGGITRTVSGTGVLSMTALVIKADEANNLHVPEGVAKPLRWSGVSDAEFTLADNTSGQVASDETGAHQQITVTGPAWVAHTVEGNAHQVTVYPAGGDGARPVIHYATDAELEDRDHYAVFGPAVVVMVTRSTTPGRNITFYRTGSTDVAVVDGNARQFTTKDPTDAAAVVTTTDSTINVDEALTVATMTLRPDASGWYVTTGDTAVSSTATFPVELPASTPDGALLKLNRATNPPQLVEAITESWRTIGAAGEPSYGNFWSAFGGVFGGAQYRKMANGDVELRGLVKGGRVGFDGASSAMFTLPAGYRPTQQLVLATSANNGAGRLDIYPNGNVSAASGNNTFFTLSGIRFSTD